MSFVGTWSVVASPDLDEDYLTTAGEPYVQLRQDGDRIVGGYHIGVQEGEIDGRLRRDGTLTFSFEGHDEMDEVHGAGLASLNGDRLTVTLMYHQGDDWTYECERR